LYVLFINNSANQTLKYTFACKELLIKKTLTFRAMLVSLIFYIARFAFTGIYPETVPVHILTYL